MRKHLLRRGSALLFVSLAAGAFGCSESSEAKKKAAAAPAAPAAPAPVKVASLGIQVAAPGTPEVSENGPDGAVVHVEEPPCSVILHREKPGTADEDYAMMLAMAKSELNGKIIAFSKNERTPDGYVIEYTYTSSLTNKKGWHLNRRVTVGGTEVTCTGGGDSAEEAACTAKVCDSIKKL